MNDLSVLRETHAVESRPPLSDEDLEAEAIRELERMERARNAKKSGYKPRRRRNYADYR